MRPNPDDQEVTTRHTPGSHSRNTRHRWTNALRRVVRLLPEGIASLLWRVHEHIPKRYRLKPLIAHFLIQPVPESTWFGALEVWGWAASQAGDIVAVDVFRDSELLGQATYGFPSPDAADYLNDPSCSHCSYSARFVASPRPPDAPPPRIRVRVTDIRGNNHERIVNLYTPDQAYARWLAHCPAARMNTAGMDTPDLRISVLLLPSAPLELMQQSIASVQAQSFPNWELIAAVPTDPASTAFLNELARQDLRFRLCDAAGDALTQARATLHAATGIYIMPLVPGTILAPHALEAFATASATATADLIYSDHDAIDSCGRRHEPHFKPAWSPEYLRGTLYIGPAFCARRTLALQAGGFSDLHDARFAHDLLLRLAEIVHDVRHVPQILVHLAQPTSPSDDILIPAVTAHLTRMNIAARVRAGARSGRLTFDPLPLMQEPMVSIVIPTRDAPAHLARCLDSIFQRSSYHNFEVVLVDNDTHDADALAIMRHYPVRCVPFPGAFNFSRANNLGAAQARGEYLLLLNNDTEVLEPDWIQNLLFYARQTDVGAVGGLLLYPNRTVQHAGVVVGMSAVADHVMRGFAVEDDGYDGSLACAREVLAVTAACLMLQTAEYRRLGGLDEGFRTHLQDVDLCLRISATGKRLIYTPRVVLLHHESATRGHGDDAADRELLLTRWATVFERGDQYYHPQFDRRLLNYSLRLQ